MWLKAKNACRGVWAGDLVQEKEISQVHSTYKQDECKGAIA